ncbi:MAG TPA: CHASE2 domain-containing protein, partial [Trichocoleus sp.]
MSSSPPRSSAPTLSTGSKLQSWFTRGYRRGWWQIAAAGAWLLLVATATTLDLRLIQLWERQIQTLFFEARGVREAPDDIVILTIDDESMSQAEYYLSDPQKYAELEPIQRWPWQRSAYAIAIERLVNAGAKVVALDVLFTADSAYGQADDQQLAQTLAKYGDRVVLGSVFGSTELNQGSITKPVLPIPLLLETPAKTGLIQFPIEVDGRIHRRGSEYIKTLVQANADLEDKSTIDSEFGAVNSFAESVLNTANVSYPSPPGPYINYYGPNRTFEHIPFWYVLDPDPWQNTLQSGQVFKDKIVLIGATASSLQDFWPAPFSKTFFHPSPLPGVEILANDIATLRAGDALREGLPAPWMRGILVLVAGSGFGILLRQVKRPTGRLVLTGASGGLWLGLTFLVFSQTGLILPAATPIIAFLSMGSAYVITNLVTDQIRKQRLRNTLAQYATSPIVQE